MLRGKGWISRRAGDAKNSLIWLCCCLGRTENGLELFDRHNRNYSINPIMTERCQNSCFGKDKGIEGRVIALDVLWSTEGRKT